MVYTLMDHRNDAIKCSKLCFETNRLRLVVPLEFEHFMTSFLWTIREETMENCGQFVKYVHVIRVVYDGIFSFFPVFFFTKIFH